MKMITRVALSNNKKNKSRSVLIMLTVFLTALLLSAIATFAYANIKFEQVNAGNFYGGYYGKFRGVTKNQLAELEKRSEFTEIGKSAFVGEIECETALSLNWLDEKVLNMVNLDKQLAKGHFPQKANELTAQKEFFEKLGVADVKTGDEIQFRFRSGKDEKYREETFVVSGILKTTAEAGENQGYAGYVSEAFYNLCIAEENRQYTAYFNLSDTVKLNTDNAEEEIKKLGEKACGIPKKQTSVNQYYLMSVLYPGWELIGTAAVIAILVLLFSVLVIYNIFQVGIVQKIQDYGKIKALGTTAGQMRQIVLGEGMTLALPVIPFGLAAGSLIVKWYMKYIVAKSRMIQTLGIKPDMDFAMISPVILLLCTAVLLLTIWISLSRPARLAAKISPIEAIRYQERNKKSKGIRKGHREMNVNRMMCANLSMNRKRTMGTILTLGLSCVLFVVVASVLSNMNPQYETRRFIPFGQFQIALDYDLGDEAYPENNLDIILKNNPLDEKLIKQIQEIKGVTEVKTMDYLYGYDKNGVLADISVMNREQFETEAGKYQANCIGTVDYDKASADNAVLYGWSYGWKEMGLKPGKEIAFQLGGNGEEHSFKGGLWGAFGNAGTDWVITDKTYKALGFKNKNIGKIWIDCEKKDCAKVEKELQKLLEGKGHLEMLTYEGQYEQNKSQIQLMASMIYAFLFVVGLISFINMANTMIISIITRKRELGVLQALGMTNRQLNTMLRNEGMIFTGGSMLVSLLVGLPLGYAVFVYGRKHGFFGVVEYHIPFGEILGMLVILVLLQMILSFLLSRNVKKDSLIERIRTQE